MIKYRKIKAEYKSKYRNPLLEIQNTVKIKHWLFSGSISEHNCLGSIYSVLDAGTDALMEYLIGTYGIFPCIDTFSDTNGRWDWNTISDPNTDLERLIEIYILLIGSIGNKFIEDTSLASIIDDYIDKIRHYLYVLSQDGNQVKKKNIVIAKNKKIKAKKDISSLVNIVISGLDKKIKQDITVSINKKENIATLVYEGINPEKVSKMIEKASLNNGATAILDDIDSMYLAMIIEV